jgi:hypothetical protein
VRLHYGIHCARTSFEQAKHRTTFLSMVLMFVFFRSWFARIVVFLLNIVLRNRKNGIFEFNESLVPASQIVSAM